MTILRTLIAGLLLVTCAAACGGGGGGGSAVPSGAVPGGTVPSAVPSAAPSSSPGTIPTAIAGSWNSTAAGANLVDPTSGLIIGTNGASRSFALNSDGTYDYKWAWIVNGLSVYVHVTGTVQVDAANNQLTLTYANGALYQNGVSLGAPTGDVTQPATFTYQPRLNPVDGTTPQLLLTETAMAPDGHYRYADDGSGGLITYNACTSNCASPAH